MLPFNGGHFCPLEQCNQPKSGREGGGGAVVHFAGRLLMCQHFVVSRFIRILLEATGGLSSLPFKFLFFISFYVVVTPYLGKYVGVLHVPKRCSKTLHFMRR